MKSDTIDKKHGAKIWSYLQDRCQRANLFFGESNQIPNMRSNNYNLQNYSGFIIQ